MNESTIHTSEWSSRTPTMATTNMSGQIPPPFQVTPIFTATTVILFLIAIVIVLGNILVLVTTWLDKRLHQPNKYFIACLAVADILVGVFSVPIRLYMQFDHLELYSITLCRFWFWMDLFCEVASITTLTVISADRYFKISKPFKYKIWMDARASVILIIIIWLISAVSATFGLFPLGDSAGVQSAIGRGCLNDNKIYYTVISTVFFFFPSIVIFLMYGFIFYIAHQRHKMNRRGELGQSFAASKTDQKRKEFRQELKTVRMLSLVVFTFIFCWGPSFILLLIQLYKMEYIIALPIEDWQVIGSVFIVILPSFNSLCNPIIYACFDREYNNAFKHLLKRYILCTFLSRQNTQSSTSSTTRRTYLKESPRSLRNSSSSRLIFELQDKMLEGQQQKSL